MCLLTDRHAGTALVVDDDPALLSFLTDNLRADRMTVLPARSAEEGLDVLRDHGAELAVVDVGLPGMSGIEMVDAMRAGRSSSGWDPTLPIIVVTGHDDRATALRAFSRGADDVLVKPIDYPLLLARIGALVRRAAGGQGPRVLDVGPLSVDRAARIASVDGRRLDLSAKEFSLLAALAADPDRVFTKKELLRDVWEYVGTPRTRTVDSHASRLRCKLAALGAANLVVNVWGIGYRLRDDA